MANEVTFLSGIRVLDLSQYIPGPYASQMLADLGAEVLKVEAPGGEPMRQFGPVDVDGLSRFYKTLNDGKTIIEIDLKSEEGKKTLTRLVELADVLIEAFRPGVLERLGFGYDTLKEINARLVVCSISGYGQTGPYRLRPGHDINYMAFAGGLTSTGSETEPVVPTPPVSDFASGLQGATTILAALFGRQLSGKGAYLDLSLAETVFAWQGMSFNNDEPTAYSLARGTGTESGGVASYRPYRTADGRFLTLGGSEPKFWANFCHAVDHPEWVAREVEPRPQEQLIADVAAMFESAPLAHWSNLLSDVDCCFEPVSEYAELLHHPQVTARGMVAGGGDSPVQALYPAWINGNPPVARARLRFSDAASAIAQWQS